MIDDKVLADLDSEADMAIRCGDVAEVLPGVLKALIAEARAAKVLREEVRAWRQVHECDPMVRGECIREAWARSRNTDSAGALGGDA